MSSSSHPQTPAESSSNPPTPIELCSQPPTLSSPNSVASTTIRVESRSTVKKRPRTSWTKAHIVKVIENGVVRRRCYHCHVCWSSATSTGTIARHLANKHHVTGETDPKLVVTNKQIQSFLEPIKKPRLSEKGIDKAVTKYIVQELLPHGHVESPEFKEFMHLLAPGYQLKSKKTVKRSILQMYVVLRKIVIDMLSKTDSRFSITFDGWPNDSLKGFYSVTLHWVCPETARCMSILLDFLNIFPGDGVGKHCGQVLFNRLKSFGISSNILATISDGDSDVQAAAQELSKLLKNHHGKEILQSSHMLRCILRTFQLGVKSALEVISPSTERLRTTLATIRSSKVRRAVFRKMSNVIHHQERELPTLDVVTKWNSTFAMYKQAIKERDVLCLTVADENIASDFTDCLLTPEDWEHICAMEEWLDTPAEVATFLGGSKYPTLPVASLAFNCLLNHCNKYDDLSISEPTTLTQKVLQQASKRCLHYLKKYEDCLNSIPARVAMFLDPRVPVNSTEKDLDIQLVESMLESNYHMYAGEVEVPSTNVNPSDTYSRIWRLVGVDNRNVVSDSCSEIQNFLKLPPASTDTDPLQWWHCNRSSLARMYRMACDYLAVPASSVPVEEANLASKLTFTDIAKLHSCTFKAEMCIQSWMEVLEKSGISMPGDFDEVYESLKIDLEHLAGDDQVIDYMLNNDPGRNKHILLEMIKL